MSRIRVAFLGDSLVKRTGVLEAADPARRFEVDACSTFVDELLKRLLVNNPELEAEVANFGKSRLTSTGLIAKVREEVLPFSPDVVVILIGQNDPREGEPALFRRNMEEIVLLLRQTARQIVVLSTTPAPDLPEINPVLNAFNISLEKLCKKNGYRYVDLWQPILRVEKANRTRQHPIELFNSGCHFSVLGNILIAELAYPAFSSAVTAALETRLSGHDTSGLHSRYVRH